MRHVEIGPLPRALGVPAAELVGTIFEELETHGFSTKPAPHIPISATLRIDIDTHEFGGECGFAAAVVWARVFQAIDTAGGPLSVVTWVDCEVGALPRKHGTKLRNRLAAVLSRLFRELDKAAKAEHAAA